MGRKRQSVVFDRSKGRLDKSVVLPTHAFPTRKMTTPGGLSYYKVTIEGSRNIQYPMIKR